MKASSNTALNPLSTDPEAQPQPLRVAAPAKINLFLHVGERRGDGFHALESLAVFTRAGDALRIAAAEGFSLTLDGPFGAALAGEADNLIARAARALAEKAGRAPGARITLTKNLPVASGIGGGSADAAAALSGLAQLWGLQLSHGDMHALAETLGSDVPACLMSRSLWMAGRGEILTPVSGLPALSMVLVNPGVAVPTGPIFAALKTRTGIGQAKAPGGLRDAAALVSYLRQTRNDLEAPARAMAPVIDDVLRALEQNGALLARMSGSGATCFGLFASDDAAKAAADAIAKNGSGWWVDATQTISPRG